MHGGARLAIGREPFPARGAVRVAADPIALRRWRHGRGRFDDPRGQFAVRYLAETLDGALKETMPRPAAVEPCAHDTGTPEGETELDDDLDAFDVPGEPGYGPYDEIEAWLRTRSCARFHVVSRSEFADVRAQSTFDALGAAQAFRTVAGTPPVRLYLKERGRRVLRCADLAEAGVPRALTQAASRVLFDAAERFGGIVSQSCRDPRETCWTVFGRTRVRHSEASPLLSTDEGLAAVRRVAEFVGVDLPPWLR